MYALMSTKGCTTSLAKAVRSFSLRSYCFTANLVDCSRRSGDFMRQLPHGLLNFRCYRYVIKVGGTLSK